MSVLIPQPLTKEAFAPFGDVIETHNSNYFLINNDNTQRYHRLSDVQLSSSDDHAIISIFRAQALEMPLQIAMLERHPKGSQAFIPLKSNRFLIVVAPIAPTPNLNEVKAFISNGEQGINYHKGVWHHPVLCCEAVDDFLVVDRAGAGNNCDEFFFDSSTSIVLTPMNP